MKTQNKIDQLVFNKKDIIELNNVEQLNVEGGTSGFCGAVVAAGVAILGAVAGAGAVIAAGIINGAIDEAFNCQHK